MTTPDSSKAATTGPTFDEAMTGLVEAHTAEVATSAAHAASLTDANTGLTETNTGLTGQVTGLTGQVSILAHTVFDLTAQVAVLTAALDGSIGNTLEVGWRCEPQDYAAILARLGAPQVTRSYEMNLPTTFAAKGVDPGCRIILSYKNAGKNLTSFLRSIPAAYTVELCWEHEPELESKVDKFPTGKVYTDGFEAERLKARAIRPDIPFVHIAAGFGYGPGKPGFDGSFIPAHADRYYTDSYLRGKDIGPFKDDVRSQRYVQMLAAKGKSFHGICEYGRGVAVPPVGADLFAETAARVMCIWQDAQYFRAIGATTLIAWCGTDWGFTDADSIESWTAQKRVEPIA